MSSSKVLFFMSGSIAAFKACQVISRLVQDGAEVQVVATPSALRFVGEATLEGLTGKKVLSDLWERGHAMDHIHLSRWADYGVLCPASASTLARVAHGLADDLLAVMILAWPEGKPLTLIPAMNATMLTAPETQDNLQRLRRRFTVAETGAGNLACGETGAGRMLEAEEILALLRPTKLGKILVTGGATREPIDAIRFISNVSTGQTAAALCARLSLSGWQVTYLHGQGARAPARAENQVEFSSFADLDTKLRSLLGREAFAAVIHAAAVSDYSPQPAPGKPPTAATLDLRLTANHKILPRLREYSRNKDLRVIGFKLTHGAGRDEMLRQAGAALGPEVDAVVANDWAAVSADRTRHPGVWLERDGRQVEFADLNALGTLIHSHLGGTHDPMP